MIIKREIKIEHFYCDICGYPMYARSGKRMTRGDSDYNLLMDIKSLPDSKLLEIGYAKQQNPHHIICNECYFGITHLPANLLDDVVINE